MTVRLTSPSELAAAVAGEGELAVLDARPIEAFAESHLLVASCVPWADVDAELPRLVPRRDVALVWCDDGAGSAAADAAARSVELGYTDVDVLDGGTDAWATAGHELYAGVNVPSKLFGELVEQRDGTPHITGPELEAVRASGRPMVIVDSRTEREFHRMSIPGGRSCPGGELAYRMFDAVADLPDDALVVVNCAGRTRSILGAQSLRRAGLAHEVVALENGTMGWELADLALDHGRTDLVEAPTAEGLAAARVAADLVAERHGVERIEAADLAALTADDTDRTTYVFDVRTPAEYAAGHLPGSRPAPGGQLVQATDEYVAVRRARLALIDTDGVRATLTASWLRQLGWSDTAACTVEPAALTETGPGVEPPRRAYLPVKNVTSDDEPARRDGMQAYLTWEVALLDQYARDPLARALL